MHRRYIHISSSDTNIVVPDSGRAHAAGEPRRFFTFLFPSRRTREETPLLPREQARYSPERNCSNKEARDLGPRTRGGRSERWVSWFVFETRRFLRYERAIDRGPLFDCRTETWVGIELTEKRVDIVNSPYRLFNAKPRLLFTADVTRRGCSSFILLYYRTSDESEERLSFLRQQEKKSIVCR